MNLRFGIEANFGRHPNGRRTIYARIEMGSYCVWAQRWDTARCYPSVAPVLGRFRFERVRLIHYGPTMTWTAGVYGGGLTT